MSSFRSPERAGRSCEGTEGLGFRVHRNPVQIMKAHILGFGSLVFPIKRCVIACVSEVQLWLALNS